MLLFLAGQFNLNRPDVHFPFIGNKWLVGLFFLTHIIFGSFSMGALLLYVFRWRAMELRKGAHITIGVAGGLSEQLFLVLIVGLDSFLLTPSKTLGLQSFFNASYLPELGHRFVGNLSW